MTLLWGMLVIGVFTSLVIWTAVGLAQLVTWIGDRFL